ncbi:hypothetical protein LTR41_004919 [Exophiala xenobiotica]|nr:hypothetical protein LTR41_004919 [Exophiala xenobiotica]
MRLLNTTTLQPKEFVSTEGVKYAILSHRWEDEEVSLQQLVAGDVHGKLGYVKIQCFCRLAAYYGYQYAWVDTCCIDKTSSAELQEAINSMYRWYKEAALCCVYMSDVDSVEDLDQSAWFTRGWTLQELIAPENAWFYNWRWESMGTKTSLVEVLSKISGVPIDLLKGVQNVSDPAARLDYWSVAQRMSWASKRVTTRTEDTAYCLMGLFDISMPMLYGEGHKAFRRLQEEIIRTTDDHSIFAWSGDGDGPHDLLASSPACFSGCADIMRFGTGRNGGQPEHFSLTNVGLSISLPVIRQNMGTYVALLDCVESSGDCFFIGIFLQWNGHRNLFFRTSSSGTDIYYADYIYMHALTGAGYESQRILIVARPHRQQLVNHALGRLELLHGFNCRLASNPLFGATTNGRARFRLSGHASLKTLFDHPRVLRGTANRDVLRATFANGPRWLKMDFMIPGNSGPIGRIFWGFSFDLSPVCLLVSRAQALVDLDKDSSEEVFADHIKTNRWIEEKIELHGLQAPGDSSEPGKPRSVLTVKGPIGPYCAIRGNRFDGLYAEIEHLDTRIEISHYQGPDEVNVWEIYISHLK